MKRNEKTADPLNKDGKMCLYAPDITRGPDGRYYLYYVLDHVSVVSVAVCDKPAGKFEFYGYVHYADGTRLGEREGDEPQFDPGVLTEGQKTFLYTGFCGRGDKSRSGAMATVLDSDMLTIIETPVIVVPGCEYGKGSGFEGHEFFEASSIRRVGEYFAYLVCNLFTDTPSVYVGGDRFPKVMQDGRDGDEEPGYIGNIQDGTTAGFKYFDCENVREIAIKTRGYGDGVFEVRTGWDGKVLGSTKIQYTNVWEEYRIPVCIPDGKQAIYFTYRGNGNVSLLSFTLKRVSKAD